MTSRVFCIVPEQFRGFRELASFRPEVSSAWSKTGEFFPMYDIDTNEIFECGFNSEKGLVVAFNSISAKEFRARLEHIAREMLISDVQKAISEASRKASVLLSEASFIEIMSEM